MTNEIAGERGIGPTNTTTGSIAVQIDAKFFGLLSPKNVEDGGGTALTVGSTDIDPEFVPEGVEIGGHSQVTLKASFVGLVPADRIPQNVLQRLPDNSLLHIIPARRKKALGQATKTAIISSDPNPVIGGENHLRLVATVFSTSETPDESIKKWFEQPKELKPAA